MRITFCRLLLSLALVLAVTWPAVSCGEPTSAEVEEAEAIAAAVAEWRTADDSLWLFPPDQVDAVMEQATAWDEKRDAKVAEGRTPWVNIARRESRPVKVDLEAFVAFLEPVRDRLEASLTADSPLRESIPDLREWIDYREQWSLNNPMTVNGDNPGSLELTEECDVNVDEVRVEKRLSDDRVGVIAHVWSGHRAFNGRAWDDWQTWEVILAREDGRWRVEDAQGLPTVGEMGDDDRSAYGPETWPHESSPYDLLPQVEYEHLF